MSDKDSGVQLFSASYRRMHSEAGVPVQISNGRPKYAVPYQLKYLIRPLFPAWGLVKGGFSVAKFRQAYWAALDDVGVEQVRHYFDAIAEDAGDNRLVLLCFEAQPKDCHRGDFGLWWEKNTGDVVAELGTGEIM